MVAKPDPTSHGRVHLEPRRLSDLRGADYNPRRITAEALAALSTSVERFGLVEPVIVNRRRPEKGWPVGSVETLVGGHQRLAVLKGQGVEATDVVLVDLTEAEEKALNVALNSRHLAGDWTEGLAGLLEDITSALPELSGALRLEELRGDLEVLFPPPAVEVTEDEVPEPPDEAITKPGDLIVLGDHRLLCGDSGSPEDLDRLLCGV